MDNFIRQCPQLCSASKSYAPGRLDFSVAVATALTLLVVIGNRFKCSIAGHCDCRPLVFSYKEWNWNSFQRSVGT